MWSYVVRTRLPPQPQVPTASRMPALASAATAPTDRARTVRHGRNAAVQLGRKVTPAFGPQLSQFAVRYGCKVVAQSRPQIDSPVMVMMIDLEKIMLLGAPALVS